MRPVTRIMHCQEPWFSLLRSGTKPVEGRKNSAKNKQIKVGDTLTFYCDKQSFSTEVIEIRKYNSLEAYLEDVTIQKALPGVKTIEEAIKIYLQWSTREEIEELGFLGIFVRLK